MEKLEHGVGAEYSVLVRFLKPSRIVESVLVNVEKRHRLEGLLCVRQGLQDVNKKEQMCLWFRHEKFSSEVYCVKRFAKVTKNGPVATRFPRDDELVVVGPPADDAAGAVEGEPRVPTIKATTRFDKEDIENAIAGGYDVDDDNDPAPENANKEYQNLKREDHGQTWGDVRECNRKKDNNTNVRPKINGVDNDVLRNISKLGMFLLFIPRVFFENVVLAQTNKRLVAEKTREATFGEFLRFIGLWLYLSTQKGFAREDFWSSKPIDDFHGPPVRFNRWMSRRRFEAILKCLTYTDLIPPTYRDKFHQVRQLIEAFNLNMKDRFTCSWVSCLDESMSIWLNKWTCPGWMIVPRKPHPFGNEYHSFCCGLSGIMFAIELVEGLRDKPKEKPPPEFDHHGPTGGLLLRLTKSLFFSGKVVILDSGFCVLQALIELKKKGVFATAVIKKRRYWPRYCPGYSIAQHFGFNPEIIKTQLGRVESLNGTLDGVPYHIFCMQDVDWIMKLFATYGTNTPAPDGRKERRRLKDDAKTAIEFTYAEPFANH